jgi:hypothetical protein
MPTPTSTGIGAPGTAPAPANLSRSPMSSSPQAPAQAIPFTRGSSLATMKDFTANQNFGTTNQYQLQTNAFLESLILDFAVTTSANSATVAFAQDAPWNAISQIKLDDPSGQSIVAPISGFQLYTLNLYLTDTDCNFDPTRDPNYSIIGGSGSNGGSFSFRLVLPIEHRRRDALGALNNSAANQRYLLTITTAATLTGTDYANNVYLTTAPTTPPTSISINCYQQYWTSPPSTIVSSSGAAQVQATPAGLGTVAFVRSETQNAVSGGGTPQIQMNNVGDYISQIIWTLRTTTNTNARDAWNPQVSGTSVAQNAGYANWPTEFDFWVNDFQVQALSQDAWVRWIARFYGLYSGINNFAGGLSSTTGSSVTGGKIPAGVFPMFIFAGLFDSANNFGPANQYLPTDATTKLQIRGATFGAASSVLQATSRMIRPVSGAALFA